MSLIQHIAWTVAIVVLFCIFTARCIEAYDDGKKWPGISVFLIYFYLVAYVAWDLT